MKKFICSPSTPIEGNKKKDYWVFLAGPCLGAPEWQKEVYKKSVLPVTFLSPRRNDGIDYYGEQIEWENIYLNYSDTIFFWFPPMSVEVPGRDYGQTTRTELGEWIGKCPEKLVIGIHPSIPGRRYFVEKLKLATGAEIYETLEDTLSALERKVRKEMSFTNTFFISDTHFGSERALELSKRPFRDVRDMDMTIGRLWNLTIKPDDTVYHLGDFGNRDMMKYLNGKITILQGNYEEDEGLSYPINLELVLKDDTRIVMAHKPSNSHRALGVDLHLFGHTHGRQHLKNWPGIDVGVDGNNYRPVSEDDVIFWKTAITKYYDSENWE